MGTCQPASCASAGQPCSSAVSCCTGLICRDGSGQGCTDTTPCTCNLFAP
jgi:hypothetical protein